MIKMEKGGFKLQMKKEIKFIKTSAPPINF